MDVKRGNLPGREKKKKEQVKRPCGKRELRKIVQQQQQQKKTGIVPEAESQRIQDEACISELCKAGSYAGLNDILSKCKQMKEKLLSLCVPRLKVTMDILIHKSF